MQISSAMNRNVPPGPSQKSQELAFDSWARYYDVTDRDRAPFIEFYRSLITEGTRSLLELACGTGAITIPLAHHLSERTRPSRRTRVVGIDESPAMLRLARERNEHIEWILGDMRSPPVVGPFDLVFCCFNTLQLLLSDDDLAQAFRAARQLIGSDGGIFAFDIYQPNLEYLRTARTNRIARSVTDEKGRHLEIREDTRYEPNSRVLTINWRLVEEGKSGALPLSRTRYQMRQYFPAEIDRLLTTSGLAVRERYGDFDRTPFTPASKKQVIVCGPA
jgi:SAM-dependent methyltransferase